MTNEKQTMPELLSRPKAPPLMPRFGLGDIVEIAGEYADGWRGHKLVITGVIYEPKRDRLTYWTCPADDPASEGTTTDWDERDLSLYSANKFNTRADAAKPAVDVEALIQILNQARCHENRTVGNRELANRIADHLAAQGYLPSKDHTADLESVRDALERIKRHLPKYGEFEGCVYQSDSDLTTLNRFIGGDNADRQQQ